MKIRPEDALEYHSRPPAGKLAVTPTKPCRTQRDLSLAYSPGVAVPCLEIERDPALAYTYTGSTGRIQDISAQSVVPHLDLHPGMTFLDLCAAPGNKTAQALV